MEASCTILAMWPVYFGRLSSRCAGCGCHYLPCYEKVCKLIIFDVDDD